MSRTPTIPIPLSRHCSLRRLTRPIALYATALALAGTTTAQSLSDDFSGSSVDTGIWAQGGTATSPIVSVSGGELSMDVNQESGTARVTLLSHADDLNPFDETLTVSLNDLDLSGTPGTSTQTLTAYATVGRSNADSGGSATGTLANDYWISGSPLQNGSALSLVLLHYSGSIPWRLRVNDMGGGIITNLGETRLSGPPTDIQWEIDGSTNTYTITLTGATFTYAAGHTLSSGNTVATRTFSNFNEIGLTTGGNVVSRLAIGGGNANYTVIDGATVTLGSVTADGPGGGGGTPPPGSSVILEDDFPGSSLSSSNWAQGGTASSPTVSVSGSELFMDVNQESGSARVTLLSHEDNINPFAEKVAVELNDFALGGTPGASTQQLGAYITLGRSSADSGGSATGTLANDYWVSGTPLQNGSALSFVLANYSGSIPWRMRVYDMGGGSTTNLGEARLSNMPTDIRVEIDGDDNSFTVTLTGATFTYGASYTLMYSNTVLKGSFSNFSESGLTTGGNVVSRLAVGTGNLNYTVIDGAQLTLGAISASYVEEIEPPATVEHPWMLGVNLPSAAFSAGVFPGVIGTHYGYPTAADLDYHKAQGLELIRFGFRWERIQPTLHGALNSTELGYILDFLDAAEERGMWVIPELHNFGRYYIGSTQYIVGSPQVPHSAFEDIWDRLTPHFMTRNNIWGYGIINEPYNMGSYTWKDSAQVAIDAIRAHDMRTAIVIPGDSYSSAKRWMSYSADLNELVDPADNLVFEAHQYIDHDQSGEYEESYDASGAYPMIGVDHLSPFVNWLNTHGLRGFVGELGVPDDDPRWLVALENMLEYLRDNDISATYWAGGPRWGSYKLRSTMRENHDEAPQMSVLADLATGLGTYFWLPYTWYRNSVTQGLSGGYGYDDASSGASVSSNFAASGYSGAGIQFNYTVPSGGWAEAGMHIEGGVNLSVNAARDHVLSFYARTTTSGSSVQVHLVTDGGLDSAKVSTASYTTLNSSWQRIEIPLSAFFNGNYNGSQRVERIAVEGLPTDNTARVVYLDEFVIESPDQTTPTVSVSVDGGGSTFTVGDPISATATASDASSIDYVEFWVNNERVGIDETAPYTATFSLIAEGSHELTAIAIDTFGNANRSSSVNLTGVE